MVCEEYFEVGVVVVVVEGHVDVVVVCAGVGGVLYFEVLHEDEVLYDLHCLDLSVFAEKVTDKGLVGVLHAAHVQFSH